MLAPFLVWHPKYKIGPNWCGGRGYKILHSKQLQFAFRTEPLKIVWAMWPVNMTSFFIHTVTRVAWRYRACYSIPKHFLTLHFFCYLCVSSTHRKGRHNFSQVDLFPYGDEINPHKEIDILKCLPFRCDRQLAIESRVQGSAEPLPRSSKQIWKPWPSTKREVSGLRGGSIRFTRIGLVSRLRLSRVPELSRTFGSWSASACKSSLPVTDWVEVTLICGHTSIPSWCLVRVRWIHVLMKFDMKSLRLPAQMQVQLVGHCPLFQSVFTTFHGLWSTNLW